MSKDKFTASRYHLLSAAEKREQSIGAMRERAVSCPDCDIHIMPEDLLNHMQTRCTGPSEPGRGARWVNWREGIAMGVPAKTLSNWVRNGQVRFLGERMDRKYLLRDLALKIAQRRGFRRR